MLIAAFDTPFSIIERSSSIFVLMGGLMALTLAMMFMQQWMRNQRRQQERDDRRFELEMKRAEADGDPKNKVSVIMNTEHDAALASGTGSGGFIVVDMPEKDRPLFHDLLKGFEDYAKLKGYTIAFSIDATFEGRIAFKFTVKNEGVTVGPERVRRDFSEYIEQVRNKDIDDLNKMPVVTTLEEHDLLVTMLKNRISFLKHNYELSQNAVKYYQGLIGNVRTFPALAAPSVVVHTGGAMDSRSYSAINSQKVLQGDSNTLADNSVNLGQSFNQKQDRVKALDELIGQIRSSGTQSAAAETAEKNLSKVRDEIADEAEPNTGMIKKWLGTAKNSLGTAALSYEVLEAGKKVWELFGS